MRNFGPSFQTEQAMEEIESAVCTGIHGSESSSSPTA